MPRDVVLVDKAKALGLLGERYAREIAKSTELGAAAMARYGDMAKPPEHARRLRLTHADLEDRIDCWLWPQLDSWFAEADLPGGISRGWDETAEWALRAALAPLGEEYAREAARDSGVGDGLDWWAGTERA